MPKFTILTTDEGKEQGINPDAVAAVGNPVPFAADGDVTIFTVWLRVGGAKELKYTRVKWRGDLQSLLRHLEGGAERPAPRVVGIPDAVPVGMRDASGRVVYCPWCPNPNMPDRGFHPDGEPEHREIRKRG